ncbi:hypothetical protein QUV54_22495, partial [Xanthomonas citri pv. citri]
LRRHGRPRPAREPVARARDRREGGSVMARAGLWFTVALSALMAVLGVVLIVQTVLLDGSLGFLIGALFFLAAGSLRLFLVLRSR